MKLERVAVVGNTVGTNGVGGALYFVGGKYSIVDSRLNDNHAPLAGSAIFSKAAKGFIATSDVSGNASPNIENATPPKTRGAISVNKGRLVMQQTTVDRNIGGGIDAFQSHLFVHASRFFANRENGSSFAINSDNSNVQITHSRFTYNDRAVDFDNFWRTLSVRNSLFQLNGNGVEANAVSIDVIDSQFRNNEGVALDAGGSQVKIARSDFRENSVKAVDAWGSELVQISKSTFVDNGRKSFLPAVRATGRLHMRDTQIVGTYNGAGLETNSNFVTILDSTFRGNANGGIILASQAAVIANSEIVGNVSRGPWRRHYIQARRYPFAIADHQQLDCRQPGTFYRTVHVWSVDGR